MITHVKRSSFYKILILTVYGWFALFLSQGLINHSDLPVTQWARLCSRFALTLFLIQCLVMRVLKMKCFSLEFIFMVLSYIFYLGQTFLLSIAYDFGDLNYSIAYIAYGLHNYIESTKYSFACIAFVFLGLMLGSNGKTSYQVSKKEQRKIMHLGLDRMTAKIMFLISFPFELYSFIAKLLTMFKSTYIEAHAVGGGILVEFMSGIFFASIMFFLISSLSNRAVCRKIFIAIIAYEGITMLTGQRAMGIIKIFLCVYVYYQDGRKVNWKSGLKLGVGVLLVSYILVVIRNSRATGLSLDSLNLIPNGFLLFDVISEFGITGKVITATIAKVTKFANGKSIGCSFLAIVPGWSNLFGDNLIDKYYTFVALDQQAWGSSFVSDLYFDFGFDGGIVASTIYAFLVGRVLYKFRDFLNKKLYMQASCYAYLVLQLIYTIRSYIFRLPRYFVYFFLIYGVCHLSAKMLSSSKGENAGAMRVRTE